MPARPGPAAPGHPLPAALLAVLTALTSLVGASALVAEARGAVRSSVTGPAAATVRAAVAVRQYVARDARGGVPAAQAAVTHRAPTGSGPAPAPAVLVAVLALGLAVLLGAGSGGAAWPLRGRAPGGYRGRGPPAYAVA